VSVATLTTCVLAGTESADIFHTEKSDSDDETSESFANGFPSEEVGEQDTNAIATIQEEITEMDAVGFDDTCVLHESVDMWLKTDA
jgi:hypothetical protein